MKTGFLVFITIALSIYILGNWYLFTRLRQSWPEQWQGFSLVITLFLFCAGCFVLSRFIGHTRYTGLYNIVSWIGYFWLVILLYSVVILAVFDIVRILNWIMPFLPDSTSIQYKNLKTFTLLVTCCTLVLVILTGYFNANNTKIRKISLSSEKINGKPVVIALASDLHFGNMVCDKKIQKLVDLINSYNPDIVILAGDLMDEAHEYTFKNKVGQPLKHLKASKGVYAIAGNHEYFGGIKGAIQYIKSLGIEFLRDSVVELDDIVIVGRDDIHNLGTSNTSRMPLSQLIVEKHRNKFILVADHQPINLSESAKAKVDLQVSGHTHNGQMWPFIHLVNLAFERAYGLFKIDETNFYITSGFGTWGPPIRLGSNSEIAIITIN
ncbi:MAG TPA: metallophosphoesterase [Bacteroidales bacterium]|nr:metallophosphoesterase [Bacteroidales bacterium]